MNSELDEDLCERGRRGWVVLAAVLTAVAIGLAVIGKRRRRKEEELSMPRRARRRAADAAESARIAAGRAVEGAQHAASDAMGRLRRR